MAASSGTTNRTVLYTKNKTKLQKYLMANISRVFHTPNKRACKVPFASSTSILFDNRLIDRCFPASIHTKRTYTHRHRHRHRHRQTQSQTQTHNRNFLFFSSNYSFMNLMKRSENLYPFHTCSVNQILLLWGNDPCF